MPDSLTHRQRATAIYEWLRTTNPHLPPAEKVGAYDGVAFKFGPEQVGSVTLTVLVDVPDSPPMPGGSDD
jgi:hypothetical protein